jgi:16S rRNA (guanine527-N7)-methyltransferase
LSEPTLNQSPLVDFANQAERLGPRPTEEQLDLLRQYCLELEAYNAHTNLVADARLEKVLPDHALDAWSLIFLIPDAANIVDIGSGAGFPGIVLAIAREDVRVTLVESISKKARFLALAVDRLGLQERITVENRRAEELTRGRGVYDCATARAVGAIDLVAEMALPLLKVGGKLLAQKSQKQLEEELQRAKRALPFLKGALDRVESLDSAVLGKELAVLVVEKVEKTPAQYPRSTALMKRQPLGS